MSARIGFSGEQQGRGLAVRPESVKISLPVVLAGLLGRWLGRVVGAVTRRPWAWLPFLAALVLIRAVGLGGLLTSGVLITAALVMWSRVHEQSFRRLVGWPIRSVCRRAMVYRRLWQPAMVTAGLDVQVFDREYLPKLRRVRSTQNVDRVRVRMLPGQVLDDYAEKAERLAMSLGAVECRVRTGSKHGELELWFLVDDPLREVVPAFDADDEPDFEALPVARREDGDTYRLRLRGSHVLVVGATGAGKGSVLWSLVWSLHGALQNGSARLWVLDPKGGMEFAPGAHLFHRYCYGDSTAYEFAFARFLEDAVEVMRERQERLRGITRLHDPTSDDPLIVVFVDELASLTAYVTDREAKARIKSALSLLLSQGRAVGVVVVAALQDPRKEVLPFRDLFPTRIALRLTESEQVDMTLGDGSRRRGAACDRIPECLPGVGYVVLDGVAEPIRVRFPFTTDEQIRELDGPPILRLIDGDAA